MALVAPLGAQTVAEAALRLAPPEIRYAVRSADEVLTTPDSGVSLESFDSGTVTGVYLVGLLGERRESIGYGRDGAGRRYMWFSLDRGDSLDYVAMTYDVDHDLLPEFLLFRTVDHVARRETAERFSGLLVPRIEQPVLQRRNAEDVVIAFDPAFREVVLPR